MKSNKKIFISLLIVAILACCLTGCNSNNTNTNNEILQKVFQEVDKNSTIEMVMDVPAYGKFQINEKCDGNKFYIKSFMESGDIYLEKVKDKIYIYNNKNGKWAKDEASEEIIKDLNDKSIIKSMKDLLNAENYVKGEDNIYRIKEDVDLSKLEGLKKSTVKIIIDNDLVTLKYEMVDEGKVIPCVVKYTKIGKTKVELPKIGTKVPDKK